MRSSAKDSTSFVMPNPKCEVIGNEELAHFWIDRWLNKTAPITVAPQLFLLAAEDQQ
jgi:P pilus assembly chaperone PapD